jgi:glycosyltransferase involved in cell wall biosynthesis
MPLVSVVLIFLNEERFLEEAVLSVCNQTLTDWEMILVDDGSTDRSTQIARDLAANDARIHYIDHERHENRGMAASRNVGVAHSSAPYLAFLDGDDVWVPGKLAEQVDLLERLPDVAMVNGAMRLWYSWDPASSKADTVVMTGDVGNQRFDPPEAALKIYPLVPVNGAGVDLMVRSSVFEAVGGFEERFRGMLEDQSFIIKVFLRYPVYISSSAWILYRQHDASTSAQSTRASYLRLRGEFFDWLEGEVKRLDDARVNAQYRRARREVRFKRLLIPVFKVTERIPRKYKDPVKQALRGRT